MHVKQIKHMDTSGITVMLISIFQMQMSISESQSSENYIGKHLSVALAIMLNALKCHCSNMRKI